MKTLIKLSPFILISALFFTGAGMVSAGIKGVRSGTMVTPRLVPSAAALSSPELLQPLSIHMKGENEDHPESPLTEEQWEAMKAATPVQFDGRGILTIDRSARQGMPPVNGNLQSIQAPFLTTNFEGTIQDFSIPCDAMVAVGPTHVISTGNSTIRIRPKTGAAATTIRADVFFGSRVTSDYFDPKVLYDVLENRFVLLYDELIDNTEANYFVAISQTSDALGSWYIYQFNMAVDGDSATGNWADFPGLGMDDNSLYMTANMFSFPTSTATFQYVKTRIVPKGLMYIGNPVPYIDILGVPGTGISAFTMKPCVSLSHTDEGRLLITPFAGGNAVGLYHITGGPFDPVLDKVAQIPVSGYSAPPDAPQKDCTLPSNSKIKLGDARTQDPVWRDGYLYATHTIGVTINGGPVSAVRYYKIKTSDATIATDETFGAENTWYFYPGVTVDAAGSVYFSFGRCNANEYASAYFSGKRKSDTNIQPSLLLKPGSVGYRCGSGQRWGDYEGISIDPSDTTDLKSSAWPVGLWAKGTNAWGSWIGKTAFFYHAISGTVLDDCDSSAGTAGDRTPVQLATVVLHRDSTILATTTTDSAGHYRFGFLDDGTYNVTLTLPPSSFALDAIPGTGGDSQTKLSATNLQVAVSGGASASELSTGNNFLIVRPHGVPAASGLSPNSYSSGEPDFTVTVSGTNLVPCSVVRFAGSNRATTFISPTTLHATILASDIDSTGSFLITVFSPSPGGGLSNTQKLTVHTPAPVFSVAPPSLSFGNVLVGHMKTDTVTVTNTGTDTLTISAAGSDDPQFTVSPANATIPRQASLGFAVNYIPTSTDSASGHVIFVHDASTSPDSVDVFGGGRDSTTFRTATPREWATAVDNKLKHKSMKRKADKVFFKFSITAPANAILTPHLQLSFNMEIDHMTVYTSKAKADTVAYTGRIIDPKRKVWTYTFGGSVAAHQEIQMDGVGRKGKKIALKYLWSDNAVATKQKGVVPDSLSRIDLNQTGLPSPNLNNVGEELFPKGFGQDETYFSDVTPLIVGVPRGPKGASSVKLKKYASVIKSFIDTKTGTQHTQGPTCLNKLITGDSIKSQLTDLSPVKKNDNLFAQLLALKLNLGASETNKFPVGLGELTFFDTSDSANSFNGMLVSDVMNAGDTLISCLPLTAIVPSPSLAELLATLQKINSAFAESSNFKDTISFFEKIALPGVKPVSDVSYLRLTPGTVPRTFLSAGSVPPGIPLAYALYQNYPNPFNPVTSIQFDLPQPALVTLKIYDILGREVKVLLDQELYDEGVQGIDFDGAHFASGVYFYRLIAEGVKDEQDENSTSQRFVDVKKMILLR